MSKKEASVLSAACLETLGGVTSALGLALVTLDTKGRIVHMDAATAAILGVDASGVVGKDLSFMLQEDMSERSCLETMDDLRKGRSVSFEIERGGSVYACRCVFLKKKTSTGAAILLPLRDITEERRTDEELRRERQRHIFLMEALPGFLLIVGEDRQITYSNRQFRKFFGKNFECNAFFQRYDDASVLGDIPAFQDIFCGAPLEWEWKAESGEFYRIYTHPMTDAEGTLQVILHGMDITARKQAEIVLRRSHDELEQRVMERTLELRESETRFRAVVEDQTELICRFSPDLMINFVNGAFCRFFGLRPQDLIGERFFPGIVDDDLLVLESLSDSVSSGEALENATTLEFRVWFEGKEDCWLRWNIRGIHDGHGELVEFQAVGADVTMLRHAEKRYYNLIQNLPIIIFALDYNFELVFINDTCKTMLGYTPEEGLTEPGWFFDHVHPEDRERVREIMFSGRLNREERTPSVEFRFQHRKGYLVNLLARPIQAGRRPSSGAWDRVEGIIMDVTERSVLDKMLAQRERLNTLGAMSDELAHEIRNPLFALGGYARRLHSKQPELVEAGIILEEAVRLEKLLDRIRRYLEPVSVTRKPCKVDVLLNFSADLLAGAMSRQVVNLVVDTDQDVPIIHSDPDVLSQVFMNLLSNGMSAIGQGGTMHISTYETLKHIGIDIRLSPLKITLPSQERMLMPFDMEEGGLNLAVSYRMLKNVDGFLDFSQKDESAQFTVLLPKNGGNPETGRSRKRGPAANAAGESSLSGN